MLDMPRFAACAQALLILVSVGHGFAKPLSAETKRCLLCHGKPDLTYRLADGAQYSLHVDSGRFAESIHADLPCTECHSNYRQGMHSVSAKAGPEEIPDKEVSGELKTWLGHVRGHNRPALAACLKCHKDEFRAYRKSIHAQALQKGSLDAPMCTDCHGNHYVRKHDDLESSTSQANVPATCANCHSNATVMRKYGVTESPVATYKESFHGKKQQLGSQRAAACSSCHAFHDILAPSNPASPLFLANRPKTCGKCHKMLGRRFALTFSHRPPSQTIRPAIYWINLVFEWFSYAVMIGLLLYTLADMRIMLPLLRAQVRQRFSAEGNGHHEKQHFPRWNIHQRLQHGIMFSSVFLLMITGLPLHGSDTALARAAIRLVGGADMAALLHRIAGVGMSVSIAYHAVYLLALVLRGVRRTDMFPAKKDFVDFWEALLQLAGLRKEPPQYGLYNFVEKFLYWAAGWGIIMMGFTGFIIWQSPWFAEHLSPGVVELSAVLHSHEALIASFALLVFHLYFAHLRPDVFPMSKVWLTGEIDDLEMRERHSLEYGRWLAEQADDRSAEGEGEAPPRRPA
jgi:formate dehydrogenase gamma subunit